MLRNLRNSRKRWTTCCAVAAIVVPLATQAAEKEKVLHDFNGGKDGSIPLGSLITDSAGNLYGTTVFGGGGTGCNYGYEEGCGTVFRIAPDRKETVLHAFAGGCDGANPRGALVMDQTGNMYGTTQDGGICNNGVGFGTVYKLTPDGTETVLYAFENGSDGGSPAGGLVTDGNGNLYGTAEGGSGCSGTGCGLIFKLTQSGAFSVVYDFQGGSDGAEPNGGIIMDQSGNLFGTTLRGGGTGCSGDGCGTVFELASDGTETVLCSFQDGADGWYPGNGVVMDKSGNLYGTTSYGGNDGVGAGTVFEVTPNGTHSVLYSFRGGTDGGDPEAGVILDGAGNLYGTTYDGGNGARCKDSGGCGVVFEVAPGGTETVLQSFNRKEDRRQGWNPVGGLLLGKHGNLYGTTSAGGRGSHGGDGVVFEVKK